MSSQNTAPPTKPTKKTPNDYIFGKLLGEGSFSNVYLGKDVNGQREYAIKVCEKRHIIREKKAELIQREKEVMNILSHNRSPIAPYFVNLYATFQDSERLYFVMTYAPSGELLQLLKTCRTFSVETCRFYSGEILQALCHLHNLNIVHRDLKPENILLTESGHILITDFGSAKIMPSNPTIPPEEVADNKENSNKEVQRNRKNSFVGTAQYVSPEVVQGKYSIVGPPADMWAFGCVIYQFLTGNSPFNGPNEYLIFQKIVKVTYDFPEDFNSLAQDIVDKLLKLEPNERLGSDDDERYSSIKSHEFFRGVSFDDLHNQIPPTFTSSSPDSNSLDNRIGDGDFSEPGFNSHVIASRLLSDDDEPIIWANSKIPTSSSRKEEEALEPIELFKTPETILGESVVTEKIDMPEKKSSHNPCYCC